jgi:hypothetical protein
MAVLKERYEQLRIEMTLSVLQSTLVLEIAEERCTHGAGPFLSRISLRVDNFMSLFETKMIHIIINHKENSLFLAAWDKIMFIVMPREIRPDYDKNACDILVACLIILGTKCLLDDSDSNQIKAGIVAQTVLFVTMILTSGGEPGPFERYDYSSKSRDLWQDSVRETTKFSHNRNSCTCLEGRVRAMDHSDESRCLRLLQKGNRTQKNDDMHSVQVHPILQCRLPARTLAQSQRRVLSI